MLKNLLLVFLNELENMEELNEVLENFDEENHVMEVINDIGNDESFNISSLPNIVNYFKREHQNIDRVIVLSNARDLLFCWYRCYNSLVEDFVYFIDADDKNYFKPYMKHYEFFKNLSLMNNTDEEFLSGKIYFNINFNNYNHIIDFLIFNNRFMYFDMIENYNRAYSGFLTKKPIIIRVYEFNEHIYEFDFTDDKTEQSLKISLSQNFESDINIDDKVIKKISSAHYYIIPYLTLKSYFVKSESWDMLILSIYKELKESRNSEYIYNEMTAYLDYLDSFKEKIYILSLITYISNSDSKVTRSFFTELLNDNENLEEHYEILANVLFYEGNGFLKRHQSYEQDRRRIVDRLANSYNEDINNKKTMSLKKIVIIVDQLLSYRHSPTGLTISIIKDLMRVDKNLDIKVIVEDNFYCKNRSVIPFLYSSIDSRKCMDLHKLELEKYGIDIYYGDNSLTQSQKRKEILYKVQEFSPDLLLYTSTISISTRILSEYYPTVFISLNDFNFTIPSNRYVVRNIDEVKKANKKINMVDIDKYRSIDYLRKPIDKKKLSYLRILMDLSKDDFVMVTVGNRLDGEMSKEFLDMIGKFLKENSKSKWIVVGPCDMKYFRKNYEYIFHNKVRKIDYENNLGNLYNICDVYVNPIRTTGGGSIMEALYEGLPVIMASMHSDSLKHVGEENTVGNKISDIETELQKLYSNKEYLIRRTLDTEEKGKSIEKSREEYAEDLLKICNESIVEFNEQNFSY